MAIGSMAPCTDHEKNVCSRLRATISSVVSAPGAVPMPMGPPLRPRARNRITAHPARAGARRPAGGSDGAAQLPRHRRDAVTDRDYRAVELVAHEHRAFSDGLRQHVEIVRSDPFDIFEPDL